MEIHAIHGFLGLPSDWHLFNLPKLCAHDLTHPAVAPSIDGFWGWAKRFNHHALYSSPSHSGHAQAAHELPKVRNSKFELACGIANHAILMGYSLGGRLAMHALLDNPLQWNAGIIISSHTGYKTEREKSACLQADEFWAERFENEPWETVLQAWNAKPTFSGIHSPIIRHEHQFSRKDLACQLRHCSRARQDDLSRPIQNFQLPILWICGKLDSDFAAVAQELNFVHPLSRVEIVEGAAHRVPWEQPEKFIKLIQSFISEVSSCL